MRSRFVERMAWTHHAYSIHKLKCRGFHGDENPHRPQGTRPPEEGTGTRVRVGEANQNKPMIDGKTHRP